MKILVNDEAIELATRATLSQLLEMLEQDLNGVAVAVNQNIVPQHDWRDYRLTDQDKVALFRAIAGG
ncbi:sulfur carrier protein ThiS [Neiella marina]|uniref:Sulfur carrier protein ThiS n=1 Tax=Neiella holothuriorum TaxID=2870530 RepID=A0ABS7EIQ8_9GAMM|nr:sulfur carrier protein ThiS [Neiella holothuriorum]MBW8192238.1 sulfur carrier protein ThiS [Neiella holothuriorum]